MTERLFTADEVIQIADETSDSLGNLYRLDFIARIHAEARPTPHAAPVVECSNYRLHGEAVMCPRCGFRGHVDRSGCREEGKR